MRDEGLKRESVYRLLEETNSLSFEVKSTYPEVPWDAVHGLRNRLAHDYSHMDRAIVWETLSNGIDELNRVDEVFIAKHGSRAWKTRSKLTGTYDKSRQAGIITH